MSIHTAACCARSFLQAMRRELLCNLVCMAWQNTKQCTVVLVLNAMAYDGLLVVQCTAVDLNLSASSLAQCAKKLHAQADQKFTKSISCMNDKGRK